MSRILVVYHSGYGHTKRVAQAVAEGARAELIAIDAEGAVPDDAWEQLAEADAIILGTPTYMGGPSWQFKRFADASSKAWGVQQWRDKLFAGFTNSASMNGDKAITMQYLLTFAMQHGGLWVGMGIKSSNTKAAQRSDMNYVGAFAGLHTTTPADASVDEVPQGDLDTARAFGQRVAQAAALLRKV